MILLRFIRILKTRFTKVLVPLLILSSGLISCQSYQQFQYIAEEFEIPSAVYRFDYTSTWQAVLQVMNSYDLEVKDQVAGLVKTRWKDNTLELNFADSFGTNDSVKAAKFKLIVNIVKGFRSGKEVAKVTVFKRQLVENDFLQGFKVIPTDGIMEKTILYRIERVLAINAKLKAIDDQKAKEAQANF
ncbi:MAG: hypothetical protein COW00_15220 [Bdellovibrio sp. CG12_big_fil_rev_8_21_14_0_65_39_13]|nr:MAG: hypothetical protein COW78_05690 [Bdellovibrio sp. CG22_combo_CG10-13_8_21_14_all_39_27]PIQ58469.1 MAG: hypothetical protein COW00_15220 [Bdellovibrio sp. CG12_big_fil_rev_8_21_14_0_65_39_13]PIR35420.1 MAG: hypothetical protein COV37_08040 [Bdellovibrio sp. CG11_big_fil_rev_8_21_14_0_20_39_38]PJB53280.1 MAG: hypothetical protein CO099_08020 [Bdellovibrio sp. CG_4_9_14_3_um_filter_39_7]